MVVKHTVVRAAPTSHITHSTDHGMYSRANEPRPECAPALFVVPVVVAASFVLLAVCLPKPRMSSTSAMGIHSKVRMEVARSSAILRSWYPRRLVE